MVLFLLLAPLYEGVLRKLTAKVQSRQGPPLIQPYYDLLKLLGKEQPRTRPATWPFSLAPLLAFASILAVDRPHPVRRQAQRLRRPAGRDRWSSIC